MKNIISLLLFITSLFIIGCSDEEKVNGDNKDDQINPVSLTLEREKASLLPGETISIKITNGNEKYTVKSSNDNIVKAVVSGDLLTLTAGQIPDKAEALVIVVDQFFKRASIDVDIAKEFDLKLSNEEINLVYGEKGSDEKIIYIETGNFGYNIELLNETSSFIKVDETNLESAGKFVIKALKAGSGELKVTDNKGKTANLKISVEGTPTLTLNKKSVLINAVQGTEILKVDNGNGGYSVIFDDPTIAKVGYVTEGGTIAIKGKKNGSTNAVVQDKKGLKSDPFQIVVDGEEFAMMLGENYYGFANFKDLEQIDPSLTKSKQVTLEMSCYMTGYRGSQTFMGLSNNLLLRGPNDDYRPTHPIAIVGNGLEIESSISFKLNEWMHIALVVDCDKQDIKEKYILYINGIKDENMNLKNISQPHTVVNLASSDDNNKFVVGWATNQYWCRLLGAVSEVRVWKTARSEQQIKENMWRLKDFNSQNLFTRWNFSAGIPTDYIQDTGNSGYEINMTLSEVKHDDKHYRPVLVPANIYIPKGY